MKNEKRYTLEAVQAYLEKLMQEGAVIDEVNGSLFDHYVVYHPQAVEVLQEVYINPWCSAYARHIYRKALPKDFAAEEQKRKTLLQTDLQLQKTKYVPALCMTT